MRSRPTLAITACTCMLSLATTQLVGCTTPTAPDGAAGSIALAKKGGSGDRSTPGADIIIGDLAIGADDAVPLQTTCPSQGFSGNSWALVFGTSNCLIIAPDPWVGKLYPDPYVLVDGLIVNTRVESGKNGRLTHVRVAGQDVEGPDGIWHTTAWIPVAEPVVPTKAGFTLHVHAKNIPLWRTDSHLAGGNLVEVVGLISLGDIVYPEQ